MIHINLNMIFYTHVKHSPTKTIYIKYYCTDCATAERGVLVKDRTEMVIVVTDRTDL